MQVGFVPHAGSFSGTVTGADDRFSVLAHEGVGPGHRAARAGGPFDTSGRTDGVCRALRQAQSLRQAQDARALRQAQC
jgi:hypothetical protein